MTQDQTVGITRGTGRAIGAHVPTRLALLAVTVLVAACTGAGSGSAAPSASAPEGSPGAGSPSAAASPAMTWPEGPITIVVPFAAGARLQA